MKKFTLRKIYSSILIGGMGMTLIAQTNIEIEAEDANVKSYVTVSDKPGFSGTKGIDLSSTYGSNVQFNIKVVAAGTYDLEIDYATMQERFAYVAVNNQTPYYLAFTDLTDSWDGTGADGVKTKTLAVYLDAGNNTIEIGAFEDFSPAVHRNLQYTPCIDKIRLTDSSNSITKPEDRITPIVIQAEDFSSSKGNAGRNTSFTAFQSGKGGKIGDESQYGCLTYENISVAKAGTYDLTVYYASMNKRSFFVKVNRQKLIKNDQLENSKNWGDLSGDETINEDNGIPYALASTVQVYLEAGNNTISLMGAFNAGEKHDYGANIDRFTIKTSPKTIAKPVDVLDAFRADYTDVRTNVTEQIATTTANINKLFDNDENTFYSSSAPTQITVELPYPIIATSYSLAVGSGYDVANLKIERYTSSGDWMEMNSTTELNNSGNPTMQGSIYVYTTWLDLAQTDRSSNKYRLTATGSDISIGEWQINGFPCFSSEHYYPKDLTKDESNNLSGTWSAANNGLEAYGEILANAYDRNANSKYTVGDRKMEIGFDFNNASEVSAYAIGNPNNIHERSPKNWTLRGYVSSEDNVGVELDYQTEVNFPPNRSNLIFPINKSAEYKKYKLFVTQNNGEGMTQMIQFQLLGEGSFPTSVEEQVADEAAKDQIYGSDGRIVVKAEVATSVSVYNLVGQIVYVGSCSTEFDIPLSRGVYIVKTNNNVEKVLVQ